MDVSIGFPVVQHSEANYEPLSLKDGAPGTTAFNAIMANLVTMFYCTGTEQTLVSGGLGFLRGAGADQKTEGIIQGECHCMEPLDKMSGATEFLLLEGTVSQNLPYGKIDLETEARTLSQAPLHIPGPMPEDESLSMLVYPGKIRITNDAVAAPAFEVAEKFQRAVLSMPGSTAERVPASPAGCQLTGADDPVPLIKVATNNNQKLPGGNVCSVVTQEPGDKSGGKPSGESGDSKGGKVYRNSGFVSHDTARDKVHGTRAESIVHQAVVGIETGVRNEPVKAVVKNAEELANTLAQNRYANPSKTVEIQLDPPSLGKVTVLLTSRGEEIAVKFITSSHETQQALVNSQDGLARAFSERGLSLAGFFVDYGMAGQRNHAYSDFGRERMGSYGLKQIGASQAAGDEWAPGNSDVFRSARFDYRA